MVLGSTQPLTEMSTRNISWGGGEGKVGLRVPIVWKSESFNLLEPPGPVLACTGIALNVVLLVMLTCTYKP